MKTETDYLIVGQGLAGTALALTLLEKGIDVTVIDNHHVGSSSVVAAGMFNPIVFKKLNKSWRIDDLLPEMTRFYRFWEEKWQKQFLFEMPIARLFPGIDYQNDWMAKSAEPGYEKYLFDDEDWSLPGIKLRFNNGFGLVKRSGYLDVAAFLETAKEYLLEKRVLILDKLNYSDIDVQPDSVTWNRVTAKKLIFCEGYKGAENPWFSYLPFGNTKGEVLTIEAEGLPTKIIPNLGVWMLPVGNSKYRVGATFDWKDHSLEITDSAKEKLEQELKQLTDQPYRIEKQLAGIRPTAQDRRPIVGLHPQHKSLGFFNTLGTKGVCIAPWTAQRLVEFLEEGIELPTDIDINRFKTK